MAKTGKASLSAASEFMCIDKSTFSRFLASHYENAEIMHLFLSKRQGKKMKRLGKSLGKGLSHWDAAVIVDSTFLHRSSLKVENVQRFNHGKGFETGHQITNIILVVGDIVIPLVPIYFYTKKYCLTYNIEYKTEHQYLIEYLENLDLREYLGRHSAKKILFLADSGYDNHKIQKTVIKKKWNFVVAIKNFRSLRSMEQHQQAQNNKTHWIFTDKCVDYLKKSIKNTVICKRLNQLQKEERKYSKKQDFLAEISKLNGREYAEKNRNTLLGLANPYSYQKVSDFIQQLQAKWATVSIANNTTTKKRREFRIKQTVAHLCKIGKVLLLCSEERNRPDGRRKYLVCSNVDINAKEVILAYRLRWKIEIFHKHVKMQLGFEDVATERFNSVITHIETVYCAYILLDNLFFEKKGKQKKIIEKKKLVRNILKTKKSSRILKLLSRFGGFEKYKDELRGGLKNVS